MEPTKPKEPPIHIHVMIPGTVAPFPALVHHKTDNTQSLFSISDNTSRAVSIPEISGRYFPTSYGWILVVGPQPVWETFLWIWNPHSGERIQLPDMEETGDEMPDNKRGSCLLSDDVASPTCGVLIYDTATPSMWYCRVNGGRRRWLSYDYDIGSRYVPDETYNLVEEKKTFHSIASFEGRFYFNESADTIGTLEFDGDGGGDTEPRFGDMDVGWVEFPDGSAAADMFMLESGGELFHVCAFYTLPRLDAPTGFGVYRMDFSEPAWRKTDDIGDRVFLLQGEYCVSSSCSASECGLRRNRVYWVNSRADVTCLYVFDLDDGGITTLQPCQGTPDPQPRPPFWMLPAASPIQ